jgi:hypothetical protein
VTCPTIGRKAEWRSGKVNRRPLQGTWNIVRFNWPFYVLSAALLFLVLIIRNYLTGPLHIALDGLFVISLSSTLASLLVSWYVYDHSNLYSLDWLPDLPVNKTHKIVNVNTGFDETSSLLADKFPGIDITVCDFYDPQKAYGSVHQKSTGGIPATAGDTKGVHGCNSSRKWIGE